MHVLGTKFGCTWRYCKENRQDASAICLVDWHIAAHNLISSCYANWWDFASNLRRRIWHCINISAVLPSWVQSADYWLYLSIWFPFKSTCQLNWVSSVVPVVVIRLPYLTHFLLNDHSRHAYHFENSTYWELPVDCTTINSLPIAGFHNVPSRKELLSLKTDLRGRQNLVKIPAH